MDLKKMLVDLAEAQAEKMREEAVNHLGSDEMTEKIASAINKRIDIPFVSEKDETALAKGVISAVSDILHGLGNQKKK